MVSVDQTIIFKAVASSFIVSTAWEACQLFFSAFAT
jgi:hypothetical protein